MPGGNKYLTMPIDELILECEKYFSSLGFSDESMRMYTQAWRNLEKYACLQGQQIYTPSFAEHYLLEKYGITEKTTSTYYHRNVLLAMRRLSDFQAYGAICTKKRVRPRQRSANMKELLDKFYEQYAQKVVPNTLNRAKHDIEKFANYLDDSGIVDFQSVTIVIIHDFIISLRGYSSKTITDTLSRIRFLCKFAHDHGYHNEDLSLRISTTRAKANHYIPTTYTSDETARMLAAVDRGSPIGKRDYAILLLAIRLGMRAGDIRNLEFENLHWETDTLEFTQGKTKVPISLPLLDEVGDAIIDYLKNGRPATKSHNVFINHNAPRKEFSEHNSMYQIMNKYLTIAGIDIQSRQRGLHALRHSLAGSLLEINTPLPLISEILGHVDINTTGEYLKIDFNNLRKCALEVTL